MFYDGAKDLYLSEETILVIRCAACKTKLFKYHKIGKGKVLRCHRARIVREYRLEPIQNNLYCSCGNKIAIDKGKSYKMIAKAFKYSGTKD